MKSVPVIELYSKGNRTGAEFPIFRNLPVDGAPNGRMNEWIDEDQAASRRLHVVEVGRKIQKGLGALFFYSRQ